MSLHDQFRSGCSDEFAELCALSTADNLSVAERRRLEQHVVHCSRCASLLADYESLTSEGIARLASVRDSEGAQSVPNLSWNRDAAKARLMSKLNRSVDRTPREQAIFFLRIAAAVLIVFAVYQFGLKSGLKEAAPLPSVRQQLAETQAQRATLEQKLTADAGVASALEKRLINAQSDLETLRSKARELRAIDKQKSASLATLMIAQEGLQRKLQDAENAVERIRQDLAAAQRDYQAASLRSTNLETQVDTLSAQLREHEALSQRQNQYLASDRDVRDLMGARQLYIADVFDIDSRGQTKKPFGRVFYTRGKSLIFYAFDLDQQSGYREVKAFQAWGSASSSQTTPVSLGIFYMDNESNRRWALKFDDPKVLEEINSVFVTIEPQGGSKKPTNKPFLIAYLHSAPPNHP